MKLSRLTNRRGNILLLTVLFVLPFLFIFAGLAADMAYYGNVDAELQRAMDAAALAGAGKLKFDNDSLLPARLAAQDMATRNRYHGEPYYNPSSCQANEPAGTPCLLLNDGNASTSGNVIVLGHWDPTARTFTPSVNGNEVNAVQTKFGGQIRPSFLGLLNITKLSPAAQAIAWAPPPAIPPSCTFPFALTWDPNNFPPPEGGGGGGGTPPGNWLCGKPARFSASAANNLNSAGWATLVDCNGSNNPSACDTATAMTAAAGNNCPIAQLTTDQYIRLNGGMQASVLSGTCGQPGLNSLFQSKFDGSPMIDIEQTDANGTSTTVYSGRGWKVTVPVVDQSTVTGTCPPSPPQALAPFQGTMLAWLWNKACGIASARAAFAGGNVNQIEKIVGFTQFVITQVVYHGSCQVDNPNDNVNKPLWPVAPGCSNGLCTTTECKNDDAIYGYYKCEVSSTPGVPGVVAALGKPKLVQ